MGKSGGGMRAKRADFLKLFCLILYTADGFDTVTNKYLDLVDGWLTISCCVPGHNSRKSRCEDFRGSKNWWWEGYVTLRASSECECCNWAVKKPVAGACGGPIVLNKDRVLYGGRAKILLHFLSEKHTLEKFRAPAARHCFGNILIWGNTTPPHSDTPGPTRWRTYCGINFKQQHFAFPTTVRLPQTLCVPKHTSPKTAEQRWRLLSTSV